ncbi:hypothetical protein, partial [Halorubrum ejinorense]|uniref:hypothetical protein n=1 Tax=Halorubrum ejinorense TaxID=425309 RepID=UPI0031D71A11
LPLRFHLQSDAILSPSADSTEHFGAFGVVVSALVAGMFSVETGIGGRFPNVIAHGTGLVTGVCVVGTGLRLL